MESTSTYQTKVPEPQMMFRRPPPIRISVSLPGNNVVVPHSPSIPLPPPLDTPPASPQYKRSRIVPVDIIRRPYAPPPPSILPQHIPESVPIEKTKEYRMCFSKKKVKRTFDNPLHECAYGCMLCMCCCFVPMQ